MIDEEEEKEGGAAGIEPVNAECCKRVGGS